MSLKNLIIQNIKKDIINEFKSINVDDFIIEEIFNNFPIDFDLHEDYEIVFPSIHLLIYLHENYTFIDKKSKEKINLLTNTKILKFFI
tara:strand:- start:456 stop:719 length:264 start_codon:yes stop_codon:yes gene_type:complete